MDGWLRQLYPRGSTLRETHMEIIVHQVDNLLIGQSRQDGYVNLTKMAQASGKRLNNYLRLPVTKKFLEELSLETRISVSKLIQTRKGKPSHLQGTWGHPYVAINCGQWCSPKFAVLVSKWMFEWIQQDTLPNHSQDATTLLSASKAAAAYIQASQALNRVIHTAVHQQTDSLREALNVLQSFNSVQPQLELQASFDMEIPISGQSATLEDVTTNAVGTIDNRKGCLYRYLEHKKLKDGNVVSYPRVMGERSPLNPEHWRWGFNWEEKIDGEWKCRSIGSVPIGAIPMIQSMQKLDVPLEEIIEFIRRAKSKN